MQGLKDKLIAAWRWVTAKWTRMLIVPAVAIGLIGIVVRLARRRGNPSSPRSGSVVTMTPEQGKDALAELEAGQVTREETIDAEVAAAIKAGEARYK